MYVVSHGHDLDCTTESSQTAGNTVSKGGGSKRKSERNHRRPITYHITGTYHIYVSYDVRHTCKPSSFYFERPVKVAIMTELLLRIAPNATLPAFVFFVVFLPHVL